MQGAGRPGWREATKNPARGRVVGSSGSSSPDVPAYQQAVVPAPPLTVRLPVDVSV
jgi:hypothetical protein